MAMESVRTRTAVHTGAGASIRRRTCALHILCVDGHGCNDMDGYWYWYSTTLPPRSGVAPVAGAIAPLVPVYFCRATPMSSEEWREYTEVKFQGTDGDKEAWIETHGGRCTVGAVP